jgi:iron complex transport system ATP-binding protein
MIEVKDISFSAGGRKLLDGVNLKVNPGEMLAVLGANGAGKSTLLKLLSREIVPEDGSIHFNQRNLLEFKQVELARLRAVLAQHNTISMAFQVRELVLMGRYPHFDSHPTEYDCEIVRLSMEETDIIHLADRDYNTLSGGEQQRVQLARVIAQIYNVRNGFLFLDEPTNGLDMLHQQNILTTARRMADAGYCVVCILHDINFASRYADNILILKAGKVVDFGPPNRVINCETIHEAFNIKVELMDCGDSGCPLVIPNTDYIRFKKQKQ